MTGFRAIKKREPFLQDSRFFLDFFKHHLYFLILKSILKNILRCGRSKFIIAFGKILSIFGGNHLCLFVFWRPGSAGIITGMSCAPVVENAVTGAVWPTMEKSSSTMNIPANFWIQKLISVPFIKSVLNGAVIVEKSTCGQRYSIPHCPLTVHM